MGNRRRPVDRTRNIRLIRLAILAVLSQIAVTCGPPMPGGDSTASGAGAGNDDLAGEGGADGAIPASRWTCFLGGPQRCNWAAGQAPVSNGTIWKFDAGSAVQTSPVFGQGRLYIASDSGTVFALDPATGREVWHANLGENATMQSTPCYDSGVICVGTQYGPGSRLFALNAADGTERWSIPDSTGIGSSPVIMGGVVYYGSLNGSLMAVNATDGRTIWQNQRTAEIWSSPSIWNGTVYAGTIGGEAFAVWAGNGTLRWNFTYPSPWTVYCSASVRNGAVYFGFSSYDTGGEFVAFDAGTGAVKWKFTECQGAYASAAVTDSAVYTHLWNKTAGGGFVWAFPLEDPDGDGIMGMGDALWSFQTLDWEGGSTPLVTDNAVVVGSNYNMIFALDRATGQKLWNITTRKSNVGSAALMGRKVFIGSKDGTVFCLGSASELVGMKVTVKPANATLPSGAKTTILYRVTDETGDPVGGAAVVYNATGGNLSMAGATTLPDGTQAVDFTAHPVKAGTTVTVTLSANRRGFSQATASVSFTVTPNRASRPGNENASDPAGYIPYLLMAALAGISAVAVVVYLRGGKR